jgi:phosphate transport system permease protein
MTTSQKLLSAFSRSAQLRAQRLAMPRAASGERDRAGLSLAAMAFGVFWLVWILSRRFAWASGGLSLWLVSPR